jgi:hypothetical protein
VDGDCFSATLKLTSKTKIGSHYVKTDDTPLKPHQRLMNSPDVNEMKTFLAAVFCGLNPFAFKRHIDYLKIQVPKTVR